MVNPIKYKFCLWKAYFEKGYALTNYIKYIIALFGLTTLNLSITMGLAIVYAIFCLVLGYFWCKYRLTDAEIEVNNQYNP